MFQTSCCLCDILASLARQASSHEVGRRAQFVVWMHRLERMRASNTGKLLEHVLPGSQVLLHDRPSDIERLRDLLEEAEGRALVLFPSKDAVPASEARAALPGLRGGDLPPLVVVLVDGTWHQAKRMHRTLEALPHIALAPRGESEYWRRQSQEGRVSTVEAAALLLEDLGEEPGGVPAVLRHSLRELNAALEQQCHYDKFLGEGLPLEASAEKRRALRLRTPGAPLGLRGGGAAARPGPAEAGSQ